MTEFLRFMEANLIVIIPAILIGVFLLSRLSDRLSTTVMAVVSIGMFAIFMLFMAFRVPNLDFILFLVAAVAMAAYDFIWSSRKAKNDK